MDCEEHRSTRLFREYLRLRTVQPNPDYDGVVKFFQNYAETEGFKCRVFQGGPQTPTVIISFEGLDPSLESILLNSHTDVVPVSADCWKYEPFSATKEENGNIYARGSQDMKCVGIQHLEAMRELSVLGVRLQRTVHVSLVPDEETGGNLGMKAWMDTDDFKDLNVGFALDEGIANPGEEMRVFYSERIGRWASFVAKGNPGHGSGFIEGTAMPKLFKVIGKALEFREQQEAKLKSNPRLSLGDVTTINITGLRGGQMNTVIPDLLEADFDLRVTPTELEEVDKLLDQWCEDSDVTIKWDYKQLEHGITSTDPNDKWWKAFSGALEASGVKYTKEVFPACTDSRYLRHIGLPALGFSPMNNTPILLHDHNEYLNEKVFLDGIPIFMKIIQALGNALD